MNIHNKKGSMLSTAYNSSMNNINSYNPNKTDSNNKLYQKTILVIKFFYYLEQLIYELEGMKEFISGKLDFRINEVNSLLTEAIFNSKKEESE